MDHQTGKAGSSESGLVAGISGVARHAIALFHNRLELAALEAGEVRDNLLRMMLVAAAGLIVLLFALGFWTALIVVLAWEAMGWTILLLMAALYTLLALALLSHLRSLAGGGKLSLQATMAELRKDRDALL